MHGTNMNSVFDICILLRAFGLMFEGGPASVMFASLGRV